MKVLVPVTILALTLATVGCETNGVVAPAPSQNDDENVSFLHPFETLAFQDGSRVEFFKVDDDAILTAASGPSEDTEAFRGVDYESMDAADVFEILTGRTAPTVLQQARTGGARSPEGRAAGWDATDGSDRQVGTTVSPTATASSFISSYCTTVSGGFSYCYTDQSTGRTFNEDCSRMTFVVNPTVGDVIQTLKYMKSGSWHTAYSSTVLRGHVNSITISYHTVGLPWIPSRDTRAIVTDVGSSDNYHVAVYGY